MPPSSEKLKANISAMQSQGASQEQIQAYLDQFKGMTPPAADGGAPRADVALLESAGSGIAKVGGMIVDSTKQDFLGLGNLVGRIPGFGNLRSDPNSGIWSDIGGSIGALADVAIVGASAITGEAAAPELFAAKEAAEVGLKTAGKAVLKKASSTVGLAGANAGQSFAEAKSKGKGTGEALIEGGVSGAETLLTLGLINKFGPKVANTFTDMFSKTKFAAYASAQFQKGVDILKNAASSQSLGTTGHAVTSAINSAADKIALGTYSMLSKVATALTEPGENTVGTMADNAYELVNVGSKSIDAGYGTVASRLADYKIPETLAKDIESVVGGAAPATKAELTKLYDDEIARMVSGGETAGMTEAQISKTAKATVDAAQKATSAAAETVTEGAQQLVAAIKKGAGVTAADIYSLVNQVPAEVKDSVIVDKLQQALKGVLTKDPEGKQIWDYLRELSNRRSENQAQRAFATTLQGAKGQGWRTSTDSIFGMLKNGGDVQNLFKALGPTGMKQFQKMLNKRIVESAALAYEKVLKTAPNRVITPAILDEAQKAATAQIDKYLAKIPQLPGLLSPENEQLFYGMRDIIPNMETVAKNAGVPMTFEEGKAALGNIQDKATLDLVAGTDWFKTIAGASPSEAPAKLFGASVEEIKAIKTMLGPDSEEWKAVGAGALAHIWDVAKGLWGKNDIKTIESTLKKISARVGGNEELYKELFDATASGGKKVSGGEILNDLVNFGNALGKKLSKSQKGLVSAAGGLVAHLAGHPFMAINEFRKAAGLLTSEDISLIEQVASKSKATLRKEFGDSMESGQPPADINRYFDIVKRFAATMSKYEISKAVSGAGQSSPTEEQPAPATQ